MNKGLAVFLAVLSALISVALLSGLEAAIGLFDGGAGSIIAFINAAIGYFGGKALYKVFLNDKKENKEQEIEEDNTKNQFETESSPQPSQKESETSIIDNSTLGAIIAECNIPEALIPRVLDLYKKDPRLLSSLHGAFSKEQLDEILTCLEHGQDASFLMNEKLTAEQMRAIRENLPIQSN